MSIWHAASLRNLALSCAIVTGLNAFAATADEFLDPEVRCSVACMEARSPTAKDAYSNEKLAEIQTRPSFRERYAILAENFNRRTRNIAVARNTLEFTTAFGKDLTGTKYLPYVGKAVELAVDKSVELIVDKMREDTEIALKRALLDIDKDPVLSRQFAENEDGRFRLRMANDALRKLDAIAADGGLLDAIEDPVLHEQVQDHALRLITEQLKQFRDEIDQQRGQLEDLTGKDLREIRENIGKLDAEVKSLKASKSEIEEASQAAKAIAEEDPAESVLTSRRKRAEWAAKVDDYVATTKKVTAQMDAAAGILAELGAGDAARAVNIGGGLMELGAGIALSSANPTAILPTVLHGLKLFNGLSGKKSGPDPIMLALKEILLLQREILSEVRSLRQEVAANHQEVMAALRVLNHNTLIIFHALREQQWQDLQVCRDLVNPEALVPNHKILPFGLLKPYAQISFAGIEAFETHLSKVHASDINSCLQSLGRIARENAEGEVPKWPYRLPDTKAIEEDGKLDEADLLAQQAQMRDLIGRTLAIAQKYLHPNALLALTTPSPTIALLDERAAQDPASLTPCEDRENSVLCTSYDLPLDPIAVERIGNMLAAVHFYWEMVENGQLIPASEKRRPLTGRDRLNFIQEVLDIAITQQALLAGDLLVPIAYQAWFNYGKDDAWVCGNWHGSRWLNRPADMCTKEGTVANKDSAHRYGRGLITALLGNEVGLISQNAAFASNLAAYQIEKVLRATGSSRLTYSVAVQSSYSDSLLKQVLDGRVPLKLTPDLRRDPYISSWSTLVGETNLPLPSGPSALKGALYLPQPLLNLLEARYRVGLELAGYDVAIGENALSNDELAAAKELMLLGASPFSLY